MGEVFAGRYELADPIGRGGVGAVWRAWDHRRRRYVAAKVLQQSDAHTLLRFVREQALRIDHPHVLAPASWAADDDKVLFTMDLVAGGSLAHLVADYGPLPPQFVCVLLDQLLSGVTAVHAEGVVHRDIKPANILLEATGTGTPHLRLSDFGISMRKGEPRLTEADYVVGTPGWFSPEQALGAEPDFPADLFAVGLVALYLLEGAKPDAKALIEHFTDRGTPGPPRGVPGPLWGVLAGLLQPDPEARFRTATGARKALLAAAELVPEPGPDDELIEVFDQLGPLPTGFSPAGPATRGRRARPLTADPTRSGTTGGGPGSRRTEDVDGQVPMPPGTSGSAPGQGTPGAHPPVGSVSRIGIGSSGGSGSGSGSDSDDSSTASQAQPLGEEGLSQAQPPGEQPVPQAQPVPGGAASAPISGGTAPQPLAPDLPQHPPSVPPFTEKPSTGVDAASPPAAVPAPVPARVPAPASVSVPASVPVASPSVPPHHIPEQPSLPPSVPTEHTPDPGHASMSETGSFLLPPPVPVPLDEPMPPPPPVPPMPALSPTVGTALRAPAESVPAPMPEQAPEPPADADVADVPDVHTETAHDHSPPTTPAAHTASAAPTVMPDEEDRHSLYTARPREVPELPQPAEEHEPRTGRREARRKAARQRKPGPPAAVALPVLLLAALCFAVGIWALTQS